MSRRTSELRQPWLGDAEDEVARFAIQVEEGWRWRLGNDSVVANFDFDIAWSPVEGEVVDLMSQFPREGRKLGWHLTELSWHLRGVGWTAQRTRGSRR
jgi:hypothetical protein